MSKTLFQTILGKSWIIIELFSLISLTHHENICKLLVNSSGKRIDVNARPCGRYGDGWDWTQPTFAEKWLLLKLFFFQKVCMIVILWGPQKLQWLGTHTVILGQLHEFCVQDNIQYYGEQPITQPQMAPNTLLLAWSQ